MNRIRCFIRYQAQDNSLYQEMTCKMTFCIFSLLCCNENGMKWLLVTAINHQLSESHLTWFYEYCTQYTVVPELQTQIELALLKPSKHSNCILVSSDFLDVRFNLSSLELITSQLFFLIAHSFSSSFLKKKVANGKKKTKKKKKYTVL